jgi:tetratricopeptide (TPR) repeat protein
VAETRFNEGVAAYRQGRYLEAIAAFQAADAILPSAALSFNAALAYEHLPDTAGALRSYRDYVRRGGTAENADRIHHRIEQLEQQLLSSGVQQLTIDSQPPGASLSVDGRLVGVTPWTGELVPGAHRVKLSLSGHRDVSRPLDVPGEHASDWSFTLPPLVDDSAALARAPRSTAVKSHPLGAWPWVTLGLAGGSLIAAGAFELSRRSAEEDARNEATQIGYAERLDTVASRKRSARIFAAAGGGLLLTSGILFLVDAKAGRRKEVALRFDGESYSLGYRSAF